MAAGEFNILADQGANYVLYFVYETNSSAAIDLTGYQGRMQVRRSAYSDDILLGITGDTTSGVVKGGGVILPRRRRCCWCWWYVIEHIKWWCYWC